MAENGVKQYKIIINGVKESIEQVNALNESLISLEKKIKELEDKKINISAPDIEISGGIKDATVKGAPTDTEKTLDSYQAEENLLRKIWQVEKQIQETEMEQYSQLVKNKEELKERQNLAKEAAAEERLLAGEYENSMAGMKQELADIKRAMNFHDLDDVDWFDKQIQRANELNQRLKDIENSYGQYGRNVGNYADGVAQGLEKAGLTAEKLVVSVGGVDREFNSARDAAKTLGNELKTMAINGEQGTKEFKEMQKAVAKLNSDIKDATVSSSAMDNLLDTMQSFAALGSVTQGLSSLFGFDTSEIDEQVKKLLALQNALQGIEQINQQMNSGEGIGGWIAKGNSMIDSFVEKLTTAKTTQEGLNAANTAGATASKSLAAAETAQAAATTTATVATKALSLALKTIGIGLVISLVATLITYWKDIYKWFTDTIPALKNLNTWFNKIKAVAVGVGNAILNYMVQPLATLVGVIKAIFEGKSFTEIGNIITSGLKKTFNIAGNYQKGYQKETERQQEAHNNKMREQQKKANEEWLKDEEAKYGTSHQRTQEYLKKQMSLTKEGSEEYKELQRKLWADERQQREENERKKRSENKRGSKTTYDEEKKNLDNLNSLRIRLMKEGLQKTLAQLAENRRRELQELKGTAEQVAEQVKLINDAYNRDVYNANKEHIDKMIELQKRYFNEIKTLQEENANASYQNKVTSSQNKTNKEVQRPLSISPAIEQEATIDYSKAILSVREYNKALKEAGMSQSELVNHYWETVSAIDEEKKHFDELKKKYDELLKNSVNGKDVDEKEFADIESKFRESHDRINKLLEEEKRYHDLSIGSLKDASNSKLDTLRNYYQIVEEAQRKQYQKEEELAKKHEEEIYKIQTARTANEAAEKFGGETNVSTSAVTYTELSQVDVDGAKEALQEMYNAYEDFYNKEKALLTKLQQDRAAGLISEKELAEQQKAIYEQLGGQLGKEYNESEKNISRFEIFLTSMAEYYEEYRKKMENAAIAHQNELERIELDGQKKRQKATSDYYAGQIEGYNEFYNELQKRAQQQPVYTKGGFGIINLPQTKANYKEVLKMTDKLIQDISYEKDKLNEDLRNNKISFDDFKTSMGQLDNLETACKTTAENVNKDLNGLVGKWINSMSQYIQAVADGMQNILSSIWDAEDAAYEKRMEELDKFIDEYEEKLDKQKEITEEHANEVDRIEGALASARGDRRDALIDKLNAEMAAQRESLAQEKKMEKEKKKLEAKKEKEALEQKKREKQRAVIQAIISTALAVANGLATQPFMPVGIAMGALAAALGAVQIGIISSQKYAEGGVLEGKSHREGGIKVLGGRAEVEGGEFITNKYTTSKNVDLLDYINSKKRKLNIEDFIEFYSSGKVKKSVQAPRYAFAEGGQLPTLRNDISVGNTITNALADYNNRPVVVQVKDIINKSDEVRKVQVLAGLTE